jgi:phospholipid methyltransferase
VLAFGGPPPGAPAGLLVAGEAIAVGFCAWLLVSAVCLGRCFGVLPEARGLVTSGPFGVVRHPLYLGEIGACAGLALAAPSARNAAAVGAVLIAQTVRMHLEERALRAAFPEYATYAARTPRLIPAPASAGRLVARLRGERSFARRGASLKASSLLALIAAALLAAACVAEAASHRRHGHAPVKHARIHGLVAPAQLEPANGAHVEQVPTLAWSPVGGAVEYEYQVSADPSFDSIVLGSGKGRGTSTTHNLAATLAQTVTDGTYYWRVRGLTATKEPGPWSATRGLVKSWSATPRLLGPPDGEAITWPSKPLVLRWSPVPDATEYIVTIATDPALSNNVLGSATSPVKTSGTVFALPGTLASGRYYWAITPLDAASHRGATSSVASFSWSWPTTTTTQVNDLNPNPQVFDPQFSWAPIPGAARYEVEVNSAVEFPAGSKWCCSERTLGTSLSPTENLANNEYYWRVRAIDASGNAGVWNVGPSFTKAFDSVTPTIPNLTLNDEHGNALPAGTSTDTPIVTWSAVPGAASYEVQVTQFIEPFGCDWSAPEPAKRQTFQTASLAWTPLGPDSEHIGPSAWPRPRNDNSQLAEGGASWCLRVLARADADAMRNQVVSEWTQLGGINRPAFSFANQPSPGAPTTGLETLASDYVLPAAGSTQAHTPLFTWQRVPGASSYFVVVARDSGFTHVVDVANTIIPAYAPPLGEEEPLDDETTSYHWAVVPVTAQGEEFHEPPLEDAPQTFNKSSVPPTPQAPLNGATVSDQPTFRWTPAEGALNYTLQVSEDPTFGNPIDNVRTDSTAYTSSSTYPSDVTLYWRVRANDANSHTEGLHWSAVQTFRRTLPAPAPAPGNSTRSETIPALSWSPVSGATAYDVHVEQPDGTNKDFTVDSTAFSPSEWGGPGIWRWQARAEFPTAGFGSVASGYFDPQPIAHLFAAPAGATGTKAGSRVVISWRPDPVAREYEVQVATSDTFTFASTIESERLDGVSWAPDVDLSVPANKGTLYWRVAAIDVRGNLSPFAMGSFLAPRTAAKCRVVRVTIRHAGRRKTVTRCAGSAHKKRKKH